MNAQSMSIRLPDDLPFRYQAALASLSGSWRATESGGRVAVVAGGDWPTAIEQAATRAEVVLLVDVPGRLSEESPLPVLVDLGWEHDPAAVAAAPEFARLLGADSLIEVTSTGPAPAASSRLLLSQLALLRTIVGPATDLRVIRAGGSGYDVLARSESGARVAFGAVFSPVLQPMMVVRLVTPLETVDLRLTPSDSARPGVVRVTDAAGSRTLPTLWETSARVALRAVTTGDETGGLPALVKDTEQVASLRLEESVGTSAGT